MRVKPTEMVLRGYAEKVDGQWNAFCLDLCLAAHGETYEEAKEKLDHMRVEYVYDALVGEDKEHAGDLLRRRAPVRYWIKFYWYVFLCRVGHFKREIARLFSGPLPLPMKNPYNHV